jgi:hypothetical protein
MAGVFAVRRSDAHPVIINLPKARELSTGAQAKKSAPLTQRDGADQGKGTWRRSGAKAALAWVAICEPGSPATMSLPHSTPHGPRRPI